ncbi:MAG: polynucleotide adenylyltransferase PcnB [Gammaproteobacteria bacterium HGW-Gammaproteobacteria-1]|jgi:poly(A) polymerase|nr:MAG: polynucleotide adenylyltransferase PcnB [Gammaproteobacteria bacterium HGW-Gammaproteobacteria-1]
MLSRLKQSLAKKLGLGSRKEHAPAARPAVRIIPRGEHGLSRSNISESALKVLYRLHKAGYEAYLVGGGVRDMLLGREPKDFDISTNATPEEVKALFRNCILIGRRFRLAHVRYGSEVIEVATFRAHHEAGEEGEGVMENGMILRDNVYGTLEDDAWRRDFTINALYYNIADFSVVDHTGGMDDIKAGRLRMIGDPPSRYREDPVRMLRAVRFAGKLGFRIDEASEQAIQELAALLEEVPSARLFDESLKLFLSGYAVETYELLRHYRLFGQLFPETEKWLRYEEQHYPRTFVARALDNTDKRLQDGKTVTPAFLFAALLWEPARKEAERLRQKGEGGLQAMQQAGDTVVARQVKRVAFPKRFTLQSREIWEMQERLTATGGRRPFRLLEHPRFRAAYDFLLLRAESGEDVAELAGWWTRFIEADEAGRQELSSGPRSGGGSGSGKKRRSRGGRRGKPRQTTPAES